MKHVSAADILNEEFFNPWLACVHPVILKLVDDALERAEEGRIGRRRGEQDKQALQTLALAIVSNAAHALARGLEPASVALPLAKPRGPASRYDGISLRPLKEARKAIEPELVTITPSRTRGLASTLVPGDTLRECVSGLRARFES